MLTSRNRRSGFTLPEVLVTVAIVAVLAAVVVPTVTNQISKGDDSNFSLGVTNLRTGITAFISDTRKFPGRVSDLYNAPILTDNDLFTNDYGAAAVARWKGPYVSGSLPAGDSLLVALAYVQDAVKDSTLAATGSSGYVIASLSGVLTLTAVTHLDELIDGATGFNAGILQWPTGAGPFAERTVKLQLMGSQ